MVLKVIYSVFIGVLFAIFVGVGIAAFYTSPNPPEEPIELRLRSSNEQVTPQLRQKQEEFDKASKEFQKKFEEYNRNVSIISLVAAILILVVSLTLVRKILLIADGLLLGGVLTLFYSVARGFGSGDNTFRFIVVSIGFATSLILGYLKFIKPVESK